MSILISFAKELLEQSSKKYKFTIHEHNAKKAGLHYDLRIERSDGKVESWAIRKGVPEETGIKRLAIQQPLHDIWWMSYEGKYEGDEPSGYGKGELIIWDSGYCNRLIDTKNNLVFSIINSKKIKGKYVLHRIKKTDWIIFKSKS